MDSGDAVDLRVGVERVGEQRDQQAGAGLVGASPVILTRVPAEIERGRRLIVSSERAEALVEAM